VEQMKQYFTLEEILTIFKCDITWYEHQVLFYLLEGLNEEEIAHETGYKLLTVKTYLSTLREKLKLKRLSKPMLYRRLHREIQPAFVIVEQNKDFYYPLMQSRQEPEESYTATTRLLWFLGVEYEQPKRYVLDRSKSLLAYAVATMVILMGLFFLVMILIVGLSPS
jgi:hypothetical protein